MDTPTITKCLRCGRALRSLTSVARGYGPGCLRRIAAAQKTIAEEGDYTGDQLEKARVLVESNAVIPFGLPGQSPRRGRYLVASYRAATTYLTDVTVGTCTCPQGIKALICCHLAAAGALYVPARRVA
jgi:hypothetical protein